MKRLILAALGLLALSWPAAAQDAVARYTLMNAFDLDGEAADADQVIAATALVDDGTSVEATNWEIIAQPDTCRKLDLTIVDNDISAGTITVVGLGCLQEDRTCSFAFTAGDDTGTKTLTCTDGEGAYYSTVSTVTTGTMTGESDETFALGYAGTNSAVGWALYGKLARTGPSGEQGVDITGSYPVAKLITTSAACSNTVTGVTGADDAFELVSANDLILFNIRDAYGATQSYERKITAKASADSITIGGSCVVIPAAGVNYSYKKLWFSTNPDDRMWIGVNGYKAAAVTWSVDANANTGGVVTSLECTSYTGAEAPEARWVEVDTTTVASAATQEDTMEAIDLTLAPFQYCRFGLSFGTGDDADVAAEDINAEVVLSK